MHINYRNTDHDEVYCGGKYYRITSKIPNQYYNQDILELAGLKDEISSNKIIEIKHGFKSVKKDYVVEILVHGCKNSQHFVDVIPRDQIGLGSMLLIYQLKPTVYMHA